MTQSVSSPARLATGILVASLVPLTPVAGAAGRSPGFEERVAARRAVEEVYWRHRVWPAENPGPKPDLSAVLSDSRIRSRVADDLKKSNALGVFWRRPVRAAQLQAEIDRMVAHTRDARMLSELFAALGNDPTLIVETLARPALADRLIRSWYASDARAHARVRNKAEAASAACRNLACMRAMGGAYRETTFRLESGAGSTRGPDRGGAVVRLDAPAYRKLLARLAGAVGGEPGSLAVVEPGGVRETAEAFVVTAVLSQRADEVTTATVSWHKASFDSWWASVRDAVDDEIETVAADFTIDAPGGPGCVNDTWRPTAPGLPDPRVDHTALWTGAEMIVWGGEGGGLLNTGGRYNPATDAWTPTSTGENVPAARRLHTAVWTGNEMIVWGGAGPAALGSGGRYDPSTDAWTPTSTAESLPAARSGHTAVWTGSEMIVWGGVAGGFESTGGRYAPSTDAWTPTSTAESLPAARSGHTAVWTGSRMIVWGGYNTTSGYINTGGLYDPSLDAWAPTSTGANVAGARSDHTAVWTGGEMIVWGGSLAGLVYYNTGSRYDPATDTWALVSAGTNTPASRSGHAAVWTGAEMIVWGGSNGFFALDSGALYRPSTNSWTPVSPGPGLPGARFAHTAVWTGAEMIVWGGDDGVSILDTGGRYDPAAGSWAPTFAGHSLPSARSSHTAIWTGAEMIVWGGFSDSTGQVNTGGRYEPVTDSWFETSTLAGVPAARSDHAAVWTGQEMVVWGGYSPGSGYVSSGGRYSPSADAWTPTSTGTDLPAARGGMTAVWTGTLMVVWGGYDASQYMKTGGRYDPAADAWAPASTGLNAPSARYAHTALWTGTEMIVWGGYDGSALNTGGRYDPAGDAWIEVSAAAPAPAARSGHSAVWTGTEMIVWGGFPNLDTGARYDPGMDAWTETSTGIDTPPGRYAHAAVWTGAEMIVWGGSGGAYLNTGGRYQPLSDVWAPTSTGENVPVGRFADTAVWTASEMIVWGDSNGAHLRTGGGYCACPNGALYYLDGDGDGYGDPALSWASCDGTVPPGYAANGADCDDGSAAIHPAASEICNGLDDDCNGAPDDVTLMLSRSGGATALSWSAVTGGAGYDVVRGNLATLIATGGDFTAATEACLADDFGTTSIEDSDAPGGEGPLFYLVKAAGCAGSWNSRGRAQQGDRDPEVAAAAAACP